ncbi:MAG: murein L,D-transpeptidase family protein [Mangrovibacterium sp.]
MRRRKRKQIRLIAWLGGGGLLLIGGSLLIWLAPQPPQEELRLARGALARAQKASADVFADSLYHQAQQHYDSAMVCWAAENKRFFPFRDFDRMAAYVRQVTAVAVEAEKQALKQVSNTSNLVQKGVADLGTRVNLYERRYKHMPLPSNVINDHNVGKMKLSESRIALEGNRFKEAYRHFLIADERIKRSNARAEQILINWFDQYPVWRRYASQAISMSRGGRKVILVDKFAHSCMLYQNGQMIRQFTAEFGKNWMGHKRTGGDKATPEGIYRVTQKKEGGRTIYYKALLINYPNDEDRKQFAQDKRKGLIPARAGIGGLIEIHGGGGKGIDWTDGCIALRNDDMDALYRLVAAGTPVVIVGSMKPLN